jgi:hypothetical protein
MKHPSGSDRKGRVRYRGRAVALFVVALWRPWPAVETREFHRDEARQVGDGRALPDYDERTN